MSFRTDHTYDAKVGATSPIIVGSIATAETSARASVADWTSLAVVGVSALQVRSVERNYHER